MAKLSKKDQKAITKVIGKFELNGSTDYKRMAHEVEQATGLVLNNEAVWACVDRVKGSAPKTAYDMGWLKK